MLADPLRCTVCASALDPLLEPAPGKLSGRVGYRCTDCERLFCSVCIKGPEHVNGWKAPCRDGEAEAMARAVVEAPHLRRGARLFARYLTGNIVELPDDVREWLAADVKRLRKDETNG